MKFNYLLFALYVFILLFSTSASSASTINYGSEEENSGKSSTGITGRILDTDHLALPGATILIKDVQTGTVSDVNGYFHLNTDAGDYKITVSYIGFMASTVDVKVAEGEITNIEVILEEGVQMSEIVVTQSLKGQSKAFNMQRSNKNISNIISADQVGQFPDANIGDAMKRIPGINVQYDQGEARFGHIRGMSPEMNAVTINGERMPSAEAEIRGNQLDLIPSDMIQTVEVNKVVTPDMDADAIGGSVNLTTKTNPHSRRISGNVGSGYNVLAEKPMLNVNLLYGERIFNDKLGVILSGSYFDHHLGSHNIEAEWDEDEDLIFTTDFQIRTYDVQRIRQSYSASLDFSPNNNNTFEFKGMYNHRNDYENRFRLRYKDIEMDDNGYIAEIRRETKGGSDDNKSKRLEEQEVMAFSLEGDHHIGRVKFDWKVSYDKASETRPNERYVSMNAKDISVTPDFSDTEFPMLTVNDAEYVDLSDSYGFKEITQEQQYTEEENFTAKLDFVLPLLSGPNSSKLKIGGKYKAKDKSRDNQFYEYEPTDEDAFVAKALNSTCNVTEENFRAGDYKAGTFIDEQFLGELDLSSSEYEKTAVLEEISGNFDGEEDIIAGYLRYDQDFGKKIELIAGLRVENTQTSFQGYNFSVNEDGDGTLTKSDRATNSYTNVLPSIIGKYSISDQTKVKFGWTNTIARPKFIYITPYTQINLEDMEKSVGNPDLEAAKSMNIDLMVENYFKTIGIISGGIFYKSITDFAVEKEMRDVVEGNYIWEKLYEPINGDATVFGAEVSVQRQLDFLPGALKQLGVYANYTYTHSEVTEIALEGREDEDLTLPGTPEHNMNASLFYEGKKLTARISLNTASAFLDEVGKSALYDSWYDQEIHLDANASYNITKNWMVYANANNLLDTPLRYYQGSSEYTKQAEYYGPKFKLGVRFNF